VLIHAGPGAGKTLGALLGFRALRDEGLLDRFVVFCHRQSIARQWHTAAERLGLRLASWPADDRDPLPDGVLLTYQLAGLQAEALERQLLQGTRGTWLAIADEAHHLGVDPEEPEGPAWGRAFQALTGTARLRLGLTGTPFRADNLAFCAARRVRVEENGAMVEQISPDLCVEPQQLIAAGDVRPLEFRFQDGVVEHRREAGAGRGGGREESSGLAAEDRESWRARNLRRAVQLSDGSGIALHLMLRARRTLERVRQRHGQAGGLVIARDVAHAGRIAALLREQGDAVQLVHSGDGEAGRRMREFRSGVGDWLVSVDMCAEGFDAPRVRVVAYLSTVVTRSRFVQAITRAVRMDGERAALEAIPREPSYVFAPADPLLMEHARRWSRSEPYRLHRPDAAAAPAEPAAGGHGPSLPMRAVQDRAGAVIPLRTPELPRFLQR
jgi:superfamily II DNA or RNA helicase